MSKTMTMEQAVALLGHLRHVERITIGTLQNGIEFDVVPVIEAAIKAGLITQNGVMVYWNRKGRVSLE